MVNITLLYYTLVFDGTYYGMTLSGIRLSTFHILNFFSRTAEGIYSKLATNVPYEVLTKCCYFLTDPKSNMATLASVWLKHFELLLKNG